MHHGCPEGARDDSPDVHMAFRCDVELGPQGPWPPIPPWPLHDLPALLKALCLADAGPPGVEANMRHHLHCPLAVQDLHTMQLLSICKIQLML